MKTRGNNRRTKKACGVPHNPMSRKSKNGNPIFTLQKCCKGKCVWIPQPDSLYHTICALCGTVINHSSDVAGYNQKRRLYRSVLGLTSLTVQFHAKSRSRIIHLCKSFDIHRNTENMHVTLVEGLNPKEVSSREQLIADIGQAFWANNRVKVVGFDCIPTKKYPIDWSYYA